MRRSKLPAAKKPWILSAPASKRMYPVTLSPPPPVSGALAVTGLSKVAYTNSRVAPADRPLRTSETGRPIPYLDDVALELPDLVIVGGHIGYPWTTEMIALATKYPNVYIDTSAYVSHRYPAELVQYLRGHGRRKVLFGTNYPMISPERALAKLDALGLDDEATDLFLAGNARRVFGL